MAQTTPNLRLPYPEGPDTPNVPRDIKALADKLDDLLRNSPAMHPIVVIDPIQADFGWNQFPKASATAWEVLNVNARWRFTAPCDGVLMVQSYIFIGGTTGGTAGWQSSIEFHLGFQAISGTVEGTHPQYGRFASYKNPNGTYNDHAHYLTGNVGLKAGAEVSPYIDWRGNRAEADHPVWSGGRMGGVFIPGRYVVARQPDNFVTARVLDASATEMGAGLPTT